MPTFQQYTAGSYKIRQGWVSVAQLTDDYQVVALPKQSDQGYLKWLKPIDASSVIDQGQQVITSLGNYAKFDGPRRFVWTLAGLSPSMVFYLANDPAMWDGKARQKFTIETYNREGYWLKAWVWGEWGLYSESTDGLFGKGYLKRTIPFIVEQDAPVGPDVTPVFIATPASPTAPALVSHEMTISNVGDFETYGTTTIIIDLPAGAVFNAASGPDFVIDYFEAGAWVSSVTTPGDVTRVRGTAQNVIPAGAESTEFTVDVDITAAASYDFTIAASTTGDTDNANDSTLSTVTVT